MELYYWIHAGWEAYCRFYATAEFAMGEIPEIKETIQLLAKVNPEPWGLACGRGPHFADDLGLGNRVLAYSYGAIEGEPSFPMTNFDTKQAYLAGKDMGVRGTLGNSQTHCIQLPNAFLFARGAQQQTHPERADYVDFANRLLPGHGDAIVAAWEAMNSLETDKIRTAISALEPLQITELQMGELHGLLFGDPQRFVNDIIQMLWVRATLEDFYAAAMETGKSISTGEKMLAFADAIGTWQNQHGYQNNLTWPRMEEALLIIDPEFYKPFLDERSYKGEGTTPFEQIQNGYKTVESFTPRIIEAMRRTAEQLINNPKP